MVLTEKDANENAGEERELMEKSSQKNQDGEGLREPAGSPAGTSKEGKSGHSQLIVSLEKLEARLAWRECGKHSGFEGNW